MHAAYPVIAGRFKDYISTPKTNGYQSLHTGVTLREPRNQKIEVQIRTARDARDRGKRRCRALALQAGRCRRDARSRASAGCRTCSRSWRIPTPDEFLENTKLELYQDQVFCFTPKGQLIQLPRGATPVDFAYAVHSQVGDTCVGAKVNGRLMPLRHELQNGDQVEIMTSRGGTPSPQWERFVVTGKARARIRRFVQQQQRQQNIDAGQAALAKAFRQEGVDGSEKVLEAALEGAEAGERRRSLSSRSATAISAAQGRGHAAYPELRQAPRAPRMLPALPPRSAGRPRPGVPQATCRSAASCRAWRSTTPAAATRCRATASSASSPPARA